MGQSEERPKEQTGAEGLILEVLHAQQEASGTVATASRQPVSCGRVSLIRSAELAAGLKPVPGIHIHDWKDRKARSGFSCLGTLLTDWLMD